MENKKKKKVPVMLRPATTPHGKRSMRGALTSTLDKLAAKVIGPPTIQIMKRAMHGSTP
jgi:hypothetical protein